MKKLSVFVFALALSISSFAQDLKFGVFVAPQIGWVSPDAKEVESAGSTIGFAGGLIMNNYFAKNYAFSTGISLGNQGGKLAYSNNATNTHNIYDSTYSLAGKTVKYKLQQIAVPIGLKLRSNEIGYFRFHVLLGFTNQFNIKARAYDETTNTFNDGSIKDEIGVYNIAYHFGGGLDYALGEDTALFLSIVYENGLIDITKSDPKVQSRVVSIRAGITF